MEDETRPEGLQRQDQLPQQPGVMHHLPVLHRTVSPVSQKGILPHLQPHASFRMAGGQREQMDAALEIYMAFHSRSPFQAPAGIGPRVQRVIFQIGDVPGVVRMEMGQHDILTPLQPVDGCGGFRRTPHVINPPLFPATDEPHIRRKGLLGRRAVGYLLRYLYSLHETLPFRYPPVRQRQILHARFRFPQTSSSSACPTAVLFRNPLRSPCQNRAENPFVSASTGIP